MVCTCKLSFNKRGKTIKGEKLYAYHDSVEIVNSRLEYKQTAMFIYKCGPRFHCFMTTTSYISSQILSLCSFN